MSSLEAVELEYIIRPKKDDDGKPYELHFLVDRTDGRAYGYVETPSPDELLHYATAYEGKQRWYLTIEQAKDYLERMIHQQHDEECAELLKSVSGVRVSEPEVAAKIEVND